MQENWGFTELAEHTRKESFDEMQHAEAITDRILILDGLPNYQRLFSLRVGQTLREQFEADLAIEYEVMARLKPGIIMCREKEDATTANVFEKILADEEDHIDYLETQLELMDKLGEELYLAQCVSRPPTWGRFSFRPFPHTSALPARAMFVRLTVAVTLLACLTISLSVSIGSRKGTMTNPGTRTAADPESSSALISPQRRNFIFVTVLLGMLLAALDQTIVATALPTIVADLGGAGTVLGGDQLPAGRDDRHRAGRQVRRPVRPQGRLPGGGGVLHDRLGLLRTGRVDDHAGRCRARCRASAAAPHGDRHGADRRGHPAARARPVPGRPRCGLRGHHGDRAAARWSVHRPPVLALGVLHQRSHRDLVLIVATATIPAGRGASPGHRLPGHPVRRPGASG